MLRQGCVHTVSNMDNYVKGWGCVSKAATTKCTEESLVFHSFAAFNIDFHMLNCFDELFSKIRQTSQMH